MKFDTVIIGGGLSGLVCGIRLSQQGQRCAIVSSGQSALHFSSGSFDLLNQLPGGEAVTDPVSSSVELIRQSPEHPYAKMGADNLERLALEAEDFFNGIGITMHGTARKNHFRITPMGTLKPTWLSMDGFAAILDNNALPWEKVTIFNLAGFLDFHPQFIADEFAKLGTRSDIHSFNMPAFDSLRHNPSELRSTNIARILDNNVEELSRILNENSGDSQAVIFPACIGLKRSSLITLQKLTDKPVFLIPTMPPSIAGIYMQQHMREYFLKSGGTYMLGDSIRKADFEEGRIARVYSFNHGDIPFTAKNFVLATGSYFSQGLIATSEKIYEPVFGLDVSYSQNRNDWYDPKMFEKQEYQSYGVRTDKSFRAKRNGNIIDNLYAAGAILESFEPIREGTGAGVSILSALSVAENIISQQLAVNS